MRKRAITIYGVLTALCLTLLGGCGSSDNTDVQETTGYWETQQFDSFSGSDFVEVGKGGKMQLLLDPSTGTIRWMDTSTGVYQDTNMSHDEGLETLTNNERSDLMVRFFSGSSTANKLYNTTTSYDSYSMCVSLGQLSYQKIDNGVRILYEIGSDDVTFQYFPTRMSEERMQDLVLQYLNDSQIAILKSRYSQLSTGIWVRGFNTGDQADANKLGSLAVEELYNLFYEVGNYTEEELYADLEEWEATEANYPSALMIRVPVKYYLDGEELVVEVETSLMETDAKHPINQLTMLPYFLTSDSANDAEEGYMFIPDGSGALIYLDSTKTREYHYAASYYGGDKLINATTYNSVDARMMMPVFGMKNSSSTIFGVIEEGAEAATLDAYVSGTDNSEPFSKMKLTFEIRAQQRVEAGKGTNGTFTMYKASDDIYDENIVLRYFWLGDDAGYVEMADCYAQYLVERGILSEREPEDTAPVFVEFLGSTDKTQYFLGIPYEGTQALTSFSQAREILEDMTGAGVKNIKVIYSGIVNGGMNQRSLKSGIKFAPGLGGSSAFKSLKSYADSIGAQIFPNLQLQTVNTKTNLSKDMVAWSIVNERAQIYSFNPVTSAAEDEAAYPLYVVSPNYLDTYLSKVKKSYSSKIGLDTMATSDLMTFISTDYGDIQASPSTGEALLSSAVENFAEGLTLMTSNPISDAYAYSAYVMDVPVTNSGMRVLDASIPFMGMVLDGHMIYCAESSNKESTDVFENIMRAIESHAQPKFTMIYEDSALLSGTEQEEFFAVDYSYWKDKIGTYYEEYCTFYDAVKGATIVDHELYGRNDKLRAVTYSNGVKVYFNYSDLDEQIDGVMVPAFSYVIK